MTGKFLKHEFRAAFPFVGLVSLGLIVFSALSLVFRLLQGELGIMEIPAAISTAFYVLLAVGSTLLVYVMIIKRYYMNLFGNEGYFTLTLPVSRGGIIFAKLLCGVVCMIIVTIVLIASVGILMLPEIGYVLMDFSEIYKNMVAALATVLGIADWLLILEFLLLLLIQLIQTILMFFASVSIGQLFSRHRIFGSVLGYMGLKVIDRIVNSCFFVIMGLTVQNLLLFEHSFKGNVLNEMVSMNLQIIIYCYMMLMIIVSALYYFISRFILKRAVNLQ